ARRDPALARAARDRLRGPRVPADALPRARVRALEQLLVRRPLLVHHLHSVLYYPLAALIGIKVLAVASIATAALAFTVVLGREWGRAARISSRSFAVVWAGIVLSAAFPFALGAALALLALWGLQRGARRRFALLALLTLAASPLAFVLLAVLLAGV